MRDHLLNALLLSLVTLGLTGCSAQQLYTTGTEWRRSLCSSMALEDRGRCTSATDISYGEYRRTVEAEAAAQRR